MPINLTCNKLTFDAETKTLKLLGHVKIEQKDKTIYCNKLEFLDAQNMLILKGNITIIKDREPFPDNDPIAWRELNKRSIGRARYLLRVGLALGLPVLIVSVIAFAYPASNRREGSTLLATTVFIYWLLTTLLIVVSSANTVAAERTNATMDLLLITPMTGQEIVQQKMKSVWRMFWLFAVPLVVLFLLEGLWESGGHRSGVAGTGTAKGSPRMTRTARPAAKNPILFLLGMICLRSLPVLKEKPHAHQPNRKAWQKIGMGRKTLPGGLLGDNHDRAAVLGPGAFVGAEGHRTLLAVADCAYAVAGYAEGD